MRTEGAIVLALLVLIWWETTGKKQAGNSAGTGTATGSGATVGTTGTNVSCNDPAADQTFCNILAQDQGVS